GERFTEIKINVTVQGRQLEALLNSGASQTVINPRVVAKYHMLYQPKDVPIFTELADGTSIKYGGGVIRLEVKLVSLQIRTITKVRTINIMELRAFNMIIGYD